MGSPHSYEGKNSKMKTHIALISLIGIQCDFTLAGSIWAGEDACDSSVCVALDRNTAVPDMTEKCSAAIMAQVATGMLTLPAVCRVNLITNGGLTKATEECKSWFVKVTVPYCTGAALDSGFNPCNETVCNSDDLNLKELGLSTSCSASIVVKAFQTGPEFTSSCSELAFDVNSEKYIVSPSCKKWIKNAFIHPCNDSSAISISSLLLTVPVSILLYIVW